VVLGLLSAPISLFGDVHVFKAVMVCGVLPYSIVMLIQAGGLIRGLRSDPGDPPPAEREEPAS
jgi:choline-glycine betaine transporter